jgi:hypothetical protein
MDDIAECTNISVGYFNEHTVDEYQNLTYLEDLCKGVVKVDWENLPVVREPGPIDTPNPKRKPKKEGDLSDKELGVVFNLVEDIIEEVNHMECANRFNFIPEKEMLFTSFYDEDKIVSAWIHEDGSITIGNSTYNDIYDLEEQVEAVLGHKLRYKGLRSMGTEDNPFEDEEIEEFEEMGDEYNGSVNLDNDDFEDNLNIYDFFEDVIALDKTTITAKEMDNILTKYNKKIESLIIWIFNRENEPEKTKGLIWIDDSFQFSKLYYNYD